jgi:ketosteroid isomerase-like protein
MPDLAETIVAAADRWMQAWVNKDRETLEASLAPDFTLVLSAVPLVLSAMPTALMDRASWLATACTRYTATEFRYRDVQVRDLGNGTAVMSSVAEFTAEVDGVPRTGPLFIVDIWRKGADGWQVCARYTARPEVAGAASAAVAALDSES